MKITFLGAAREVTGSSYLVEAGGVRFLVDCGMFQGGRETRAKNSRAFSFDPRSIDFVLLTHAHIDHSGLLPRLVAMGFRGTIHTTRATCDLLAVMLPDSAHIQEKEAEYANLDRFRKGMQRREQKQGLPPRDVAPLYTVAQAQASLRQLNPVDYDLEIAPHPDVRCTFRDAGHILGSAIVEVWVGEGAGRRKIVFSGDLGQPSRPLLQDPVRIADADYLVVESTYGNRNHKSMEATQDELVEAINTTIEKKGGNVVIPAFAVGRTQDILYLLADLTRQARIPKLSVFVDSPMATAATEITYKHMALLDAETHALMGRHGGAAHFRKLNFVESVEESKSLDRVTGGVVILSASGMCEAGRIKFHLRANLPRRESAILITGFQAAGTLGRRLVDGARRVRLLGEDIPVRADLYTLGGLSAHADRGALLAWLGHFSSTRKEYAGGDPAAAQRPLRSTRKEYAGGDPAAAQRPLRSTPRRVFVVHGEEAVATQFAADLRAQFGWDAMAPEPGFSVVLD